MKPTSLKAESCKRIEGLPTMVAKRLGITGISFLAYQVDEIHPMRHPSETLEGLIPPRAYRNKSYGFQNGNSFRGAVSDFDFVLSLVPPANIQGNHSHMGTPAPSNYPLQLGFHPFHKISGCNRRVELAQRGNGATLTPRLSSGLPIRKGTFQSIMTGPNAMHTPWPGPYAEPKAKDPKEKNPS